MGGSNGLSARRTSVWQQGLEEVHMYLAQPARITCNQTHTLAINELTSSTGLDLWLIFKIGWKLVQRNWVEIIQQRRFIERNYKCSLLLDHFINVFYTELNLGYDLPPVVREVVPVARQLAKYVPLVLVKMGKHGVLLCHTLPFPDLLRTYFGDRRSATPPPSSTTSV